MPRLSYQNFDDRTSAHRLASIGFSRSWRSDTAKLLDFSRPEEQNGGIRGTQCQKRLEGSVKVQNKVVVVTGAGAGMGREVTLELLRRGAKAVVAVDVKQEAINETITLAGDNVHRISSHVVDISNIDQVKELPARVLELHAQVDGLINVAGIIHKFHTVADLSYEEIHRVFNVNFFGTVHMVKEFLPHLLARPEAQITNISSMGSYVPVPGQTVYGASKAAVKLFTEGLRSELAEIGRAHV